MRFSPRLFRRHIGGSADDQAIERHSNVPRIATRQAKVGHVGVVVVIQEDIGRLQIAMHHAMLVNMMEGPRDRAHKLHGFADRESGPPEPLRQGLALNQIADQENPVAIPPNFMNCDDVWMPNLGHGTCFAEE